MLEWDLEEADLAVEKELKHIDNFLREHESKIKDVTEILDKDGSNFYKKVFIKKIIIL